MTRRRLGPFPVRELVQPRSPQWLWDACCRGDEPAEALDHRDREDLFVGFWEAGWPATVIAGHTRSTPYTVTRVLDRVLPARSRGWGRAA